MPLNLKHFLFFFLPFTLFAQVQEEISPPSFIKSIIFKGETDDQFPIVQLGDPIYLDFDDITAGEYDYYYKLKHCNYDWTPSDLLKSQYLNGIDNQRIIDYSNSYNTLQPYSNYKLTIPNDNVKLKISGNYMLEIYDSNYEIVFSRRFVVYQNLVTVGITPKRTRDFEFLNEKQITQININYSNFSLVNPKKEVKIAILQNYYWPTAILNIAPQFTLGTELVYKYDTETSFYAGNEFLNFDSKDLRAATAAISSIELLDIYNHYLFTNIYRNSRPYTYFPDINGDFVIRTLQGDDSSREAEYSNVHFSLAYKEELGLDEVYVFGKFNNYAITDENKMTYNAENGLLEASMLLKQGFYNYKYVTKQGDKIDLNKISGNFHNTENHYLVLVYYRNFGNLYDSIIGIGSASATNISN